MSKNYKTCHRLNLSISDSELPCAEIKAILTNISTWFFSLK